MHSRVSVLSLGLNLALAAALYWALRNRESEPSPSHSDSSDTNAPPNVARTNFVVRRQFFNWREIESTDYRTYIANLRRIGCPESTIRDIIVAEVNALFDRKRATEIVLPEQHWWGSEPNPESVKAAQTQFEALESERRALLTELLGANWEDVTNAELAAFNLRLDGPVLGTLPLRVKQALHDAEDRAAARRQAYLEAQQQAGKPADAKEMARLAQENRRELAQILNPPQLEEYLLRYSTTAQSLRATLRGFEVSQDEFRKMFRVRDGLDQQMASLPTGGDPVSLTQRQEFERQRELAMRDALGADRYQMFKYNQDPIFRQAKSTAEQVGASPEMVLPLYQINQAVETERQRIRNDTNMTLEQRATALANMLTQQQESLRRILGDKAYELYRVRIQQE